MNEKILIIEKIDFFCQMCLGLILKWIKTRIYGFPWWLSSKNPPASARDTGSISGPFQEVSHAAEQLSPSSTTIEPVEPGNHNY